MDGIQRIPAASAGLSVEDIRECVRSQKEDWQQVPWLALHAAGYHGYPQENYLAYSLGLWPLRVPAGKYSRIAAFVDCATGDLVDGGLHPERPEKVELLAAHIDQLDAAEVISRLNVVISEGQRRIPLQDDGGHRDRLMTWHVLAAKELGVERVYVRRSRHEH